ncbi:sarcosine oxidase subunit gamma [Roseinatronobacter monicus]|uniref:Sarcosine oxidase subunit gamma n=1 Tax=Roseinatronobacter monicus TaxID=393481 RepID=A0A543KDN0_9RHOB|nr:sarcosine oxidase subunit gamma family protein [Roseinatronobacter monicus]TQM93191.1 sarcosine oxidase subunit gamma [Roseinatronobacter monicus]
MSDLAQSALPGAQFDGFVSVREAGLQGMITLRGALDSEAVTNAVQQATGCAMPAPRRVTSTGAYAVAWMSPDEVMILCPHDKAREIASGLADALKDSFATLAVVSDARAVFTLHGAGWRNALAKICPVDFGTLTEGDIRRTRAAQVAAAIWVSGTDEATLVCFRSVAEYMFELLSTVSKPGSEPALYR